MSEETPVKELKVVARLVCDGKEVTKVCKSLTINETEEITEDREVALVTRTLDDIVSDFLNEVLSVAQQNNYSISKEAIAKSTVALFLFIIKETEQEITLDIELEKIVEDENGDSKKDDS